MTVMAEAGIVENRADSLLIGGRLVYHNSSRSDDLGDVLIRREETTGDLGRFPRSSDKKHAFFWLSVLNQAVEDPQQLG